SACGVNASGGSVAIALLAGVVAELALAPIGIPRSTFYDWYSRYQEGGIEALVDGKPRPRRIWNKIPDKIQTAIVNLALEEPDLSRRELAVNFTDTKGSFVSEATVYRLLKDHGLITSPAFILMKAADRFANPTRLLLVLTTDLVKPDIHDIS